jgi:hypothetical protein
MDAEGNFQTFPKKRTSKDGVLKYYNVGYGIHLGMHIRDTSLLRYLKRELSLPGRVYIYPHREEVRLGFTKLRDMRRLIIKVFNKYPLCNEKNRENLSRLKYGIFNHINRFETFDEYQAFISNKQL